MAKLASLAIAVLFLAVPALASSPEPGYRSDSTPEKASLIGLVTDADGNPVPNAQVTFVHFQYGWFGGTTKDDGRYVIDTHLGDGVLSASGKGYACTEQNLLVESNPQTADLTLAAIPEPTAILTGRVTSADGAPLSGASIGLSPQYSYPEKPVPLAADGATSDAAIARPYYGSPCAGNDPRMTYQSATTDDSGVYTIKHYGGAFTLDLRARGHVGDNDQVTLVDGETVVKDFQLEPVPKDTVTVTGIVKDATTGLPIANARVDWYNLQYGKWYQGTFTDAAGVYTVNVLPGYTRISVTAEKGAWYYTTDPVATTDDVEAKRIGMPEPIPTPTPGGQLLKSYYPANAYVNAKDGEKATADFRLLPKPEPTVVLIGYVVDEAAQRGIPGAQVYVYNVQTGEYGSAVTDATGSYKILVNPGYLNLNTWVDGYFERQEYLLVDAGETTVRHDLLLTAGKTQYIDWWYEQYGGDGGVYYSRSAVATPVAGEADQAEAGPGAPIAPPTPTSLDKAASPGVSESGTTSDKNVYKGTGGGLPPYSPAAAIAPEDTTEANSDATNTVPAADAAKRTVPGIGLLALAVGLGAAALVLRRRG